MSKGNDKSSRTEKILFIVEHPELLDATNKTLAKALKSAGLIARGTYAPDIRPKRLFEEARKIIADRNGGAR